MYLQSYGLALSGFGGTQYIVVTDTILAVARAADVHGVLSGHPRAASRL